LKDPIGTDTPLSKEVLNQTTKKHLKPIVDE
jgi:hypothetical protein